MASDLNEEALTAAHIAIEDMLVELRDRRISMMNRNGFVIHERDGQPSSVIRLGTRAGLEVGIRAYLAALDPAEAQRVIEDYTKRIAAERAGMAAIIRELDQRVPASAEQYVERVADACKAAEEETAEQIAAWLESPRDKRDLGLQSMDEFHRAQIAVAVRAGRWKERG